MIFLILACMIEYQSLKEAFINKDFIWMLFLWSWSDCIKSLFSNVLLRSMEDIKATSPG